MPFNILDAPVEELNSMVFTTARLQVSVLRLDKIHPVVSGNKIFKLHYFLKAAVESPNKTLLTFGGAYSNHLAATAYACKQAGVKSIAVVRGEKPSVLSHTLQHCLDNGMHLKFVTREDYTTKDEIIFLQQLQNEFGECIIVPEGGFGVTGAKGAAKIYECIPSNTFTHICTAVGTATTAAGLLSSTVNETIICIPVLKGMTDIKQRIALCGVNIAKANQLQILDEYHFGGYAKKTPELISFMNELWQQFQLPTDFVYTAKMFYAIFDKIKKGWFTPGCNILCIHTGGLQGNLSLPAGSLLF